jgi:hypothetical protein
MATELGLIKYLISGTVMLNRKENPRGIKLNCHFMKQGLTELGIFSSLLGETRGWWFLCVPLGTLLRQKLFFLVKTRKQKQIKFSKIVHNFGLHKNAGGVDTADH